MRFMPESAEKQLGATAVCGKCDERFAVVRAEFERNFAYRGELGASVCVWYRGQKVVDLWGGISDPALGTAWADTTLAVVFSCTKGAVALCVHMLAACGAIDLDAPLARYSPSFAGGGKADITVRMVLSHQAGLPGVTRPIDTDTARDLDAMVDVLAGEEPLWRPGTRYGYHALTFGWLLGELVRRATGETVGAFFQREVAQPLGLHFWIGLPESETARIAPIVAPAQESTSPSFDAALRAREPIQVAMVNARGGVSVPELCDTKHARRLEIPAANGTTNARGLAGMYAPLAIGGAMNGGYLLDPVHAGEVGFPEAASAMDAVYLEPSCHSAGFEKATPGRLGRDGQHGLRISESAFGHSGLGGSVGFADPTYRFSFGYVTNYHTRPGEAVGARRQPLIDAAYEAVARLGTAPA